VEGASSDTIHYFRYLEDYLFLRARLDRAERVLVVGGGFIGVELAAAFSHAGKSVMLVYSEDYPLRRVLPRDLGEFVADYYRDRGVETVSGDSVAELSPRAGSVLARTQGGADIAADLVVAGVGLQLHTELADGAGLDVSDGIVVSEHLRTTDPHVYAAGDVAEFPCLPLGERMRVEHWDNALQMGRCAGANMAGAERTYDHLAMFYSDLFDLGWEAVGQVDSRLDVFPVWKQEFREGMLFYLRDDVVRGVLLWNVWERVEWARQLVREGVPRTRAELGRIAAL
jgi:NADPH-dependent 2,4-dienoyl-CoA reductase/sulfur reductase-like enzyme